MSFRMTICLAGVGALLAGPLHAQSQQGAATHSGTVTATPASALAWAPITPPGFDPGMEIAVVRGDPAVVDGPYIIRLRFPAGYRFPAHWHPVTENLTVLEGEFLLAMGERADESKLTAVYRPGDFIFAEAKMPHFGGARVPTVIQLHGNGPFAIIVVGSKEDVR